MYPIVCCHVICHVIIFTTLLLNCLKKPKEQTKSKKVLQTTPILYETDPAILEKERKRKAAENRARMKKKREKMTMSRTNNVVEQQQQQQQQLGEPKRAPVDALKIPEDSTQPTNSDELLMGTAGGQMSFEGGAEKSQETVQDEGQRINSLVLETEEEEKLGDVKLVDNDPDAARKAHQIKKQARDLAKKKQTEEAIMRRMQMMSDSASSPDDTLKNVSSIQFESQLSMIQKKRQKIDATSSEEQTKTAEIVDAKSSHLYANFLGKRAAVENK